MALRLAFAMVVMDEVKRRGFSARNAAWAGQNAASTMRRRRSAGCEGLRGSRCEDRFDRLLHCECLREYRKRMRFAARHRRDGCELAA
jgi:hypothetical protein